MSYCDERGYAYLLNLVEVEGDPAIHFRPHVEDVAWMMLPARARLDYDQELLVGPRIQAELAACGRAIAGGHPQPDEGDHCAPCVGGWPAVATALRQQLEARWAEVWPELPRDQALADYFAHYPQMRPEA